MCKRIALRWPAAALLCGVVCCTVLAADELPITDPTEPPPGAAGGLAQPRDDVWLLYSTQVSDSKRSAVVNSRVVTVGSCVAGAVVTAIEPGQVTLMRDSRRIVLRLVDTPVRRGSKDSS